MCRFLVAVRVSCALLIYPKTSATERATIRLKSAEINLQLSDFQMAAAIIEGLAGNPFSHAGESSR